MITEPIHYLSVKELHQYLHLDEYYGPDTTNTKEAVLEIYRQNENKIQYRNFRSDFSEKYYKNDHIRELIFLWFGFMGLAAYKNEKPVSIKSDQMIIHVGEMFDYYFDENELKRFLINNKYPLPHTYFPDEPDTPSNRLKPDETKYGISDEEIEQYFETIKPVYTKSMNDKLSRIQVELKAIQIERKQLSQHLYNQPPAEVKDQLTWDKERERRKTNSRHTDDLNKEVNKLRNRQHVVRYLAKKQGVHEEWLQVKGMNRNKINDIHKQAEILNILNNRCLQLQEVCNLIESSDISQEYSLSSGDISVLRGSWESAVDAVKITLSDGTHSPEHKTENESPIERKERLERWFKDEQQIKQIGALQRTADREGIARQTLSGIFKPKKS